MKLEIGTEGFSKTELDKLLKGGFITRQRVSRYSSDHSFLELKNLCELEALERFSDDEFRKLYDSGISIYLTIAGLQKVCESEALKHLTAEELKTLCKLEVLERLTVKELRKLCNSKVLRRLDAEELQIFFGFDLLSILTADELEPSPLEKALAVRKVPSAWESVTF